MAGVQSITCVPADDGAIQRALASLDAQMDAWLAAMKRVETTLRAMPSESAPSAAPSAPVFDQADTPDQTDAAPVESAQAPDIMSILESVASPLPPTTSGYEPLATASEPVAQSVVPEPVPTAERMADRPAVKPKRGIVAMTQPVKDSPAVTISSPAQGEMPAELDGEALLATLDEETARAIRMMRRLASGHTSVRELLAEYQARQAGPTVVDTGKKSRWWRGK